MIELVTSIEACVDSMQNLADRMSKKEALKKAREKSVSEREVRFFEAVTAAGSYVEENPGRCLNEIKRAMNWTLGKTQHVLNYCEKENYSIRSELVIEKGRSKRKFYPVPWYNGLDWSNFEDDEITREMVEKVIALQKKAFDHGILIEIEDDFLRKKIHEVLEEKFRQLKSQ
ncbi:MAG: hypothetical protein ACTSRU_12000 [Candidatus Hodarchaeales archaeon]